jgi:hypothetical protein
MDDFWQTLGINADASRETIKSAYAAKLKLAPPDRQPEAFAELRRAYEMALASFNQALAGFESARSISASGDDIRSVGDASVTHAHVDFAQHPAERRKPDLASGQKVLAEFFERSKTEPDAAIRWLHEHDDFVALHHRDTINAALDHDLSTDFRWDMQVLQRLGQELGLVSEQGLRPDLGVTNFDVFVGRSWAHFIGVPVADRLIEQLSEQSINAQLLVQRLRSLDQRWIPIIEQIFIERICQSHMPSSVVLTLETVFGWQSENHKGVFAKYLDRARFEDFVKSLPGSSKGLAPRGQAMNFLKYKRTFPFNTFVINRTQWLQAVNVLKDAKALDCDLPKLFDLSQIQIGNRIAANRKGFEQRGAIISLIALFVGPIWFLGVASFDIPMILKIPQWIIAASLVLIPVRYENRKF